MASPTTKASVSECSIVPKDEPQRDWLVLFPPWEFTKKKSQKSILYKARFRSDIRKTTLSAPAANHWQKLPHDIKDLNLSILSRKAKQYLLRKQM